MENGIRAVIFDLGGVIVRTEDPGPRLALAGQLGKTRAELERIVFANPVYLAAERGLATPEEAWAYAAHALGLPPGSVDGFQQAFFAGDRVDFTLVSCIRALRPAYTTVALSNTILPDLEQYLSEQMRAPGTFDVLVSSARVGLVKPDPEIYRYALAQAGCVPEQAVFVDDNGGNIAAAAGLGLRAIHFRSTDQALGELAGLLGHPC